MYDFYLRCNGSNITLHYILTLGVCLFVCLFVCVCVCVRACAHARACTCAQLYIQMGKGSIQLITAGGFGDLCVCLCVCGRLLLIMVYPSSEMYMLHPLCSFILKTVRLTE